MKRNHWLVAALVVFALVLSAKAADDPKGPQNKGTTDPDFIIGVDDILSINVWKEAEVTRQVPVRPDGKISLPLIGDIQAKGLTPLQLKDEITKALSKFLSSPEVTVIVTEVRSRKFNVVGQVNRPGSFPLLGHMTILDALAMCGGLRDFAKQSKIYVLRTGADGKQQKLPFDYKAVVKGDKVEQNIELEPRDTIVVP